MPPERERHARLGSAPVIINKPQLSLDSDIQRRPVVRSSDRTYETPACESEMIHRQLMGEKSCLAVSLISLTSVHSVFKLCYLSVHSARSAQYAVDFTSRSPTSCLGDLGGNAMLQYGRAYR